jgi:hypothetical protein
MSLDTESILLLLRFFSGALLLLLLYTLFGLLWRDYRSANRDAEASRRTYGRIVVLREQDGSFLVTGETFPLLPLTSLGRSPTNSIRIEDTFASSEHALLALRGGRWWLEDRQSRNGTMLNGIAVNQPVIVTDGDMIGIGHMRYRLEMES